MFPNVTLHDIQLARGTVTYKPVLAANGYVVIETRDVCPQHNPRLTALVTNPRTGKQTYQRINSFYDVSLAGKYDAKVPSEYLTASLFVDDVYSAII